MNTRQAATVYGETARWPVFMSAGLAVATELGFAIAQTAQKYNSNPARAQNRGM
jgi:hypothetical protein